jgi:hypothetical protein
MLIQVGQRNVRAGGEVSIPVWMSNGADIANINYEVKYNAGVAVAVPGGVSKGSFFAGALQQANTEPAGTVRVGNSQTKGENGTGSISYIKFKATGRAGQKTDLTVTVTAINDPSGKALVIDRIDGLIQIVDAQTGLLPGDCSGKGYLDTSDAVCALQMSVGLRPVDLVVDLDASGDVTSRDSTLIQQQVASTI